MFPKLNLMKLFYEANAGAGGGTSAASEGEGGGAQNEGGQQGAPATVESFDAWYSSQNDDIKKLANPLKEHFERMQNTVKETRKERDTLSRQFRDAAKKLEAGSDAQKKLEELATNFDEANRRADFYEEAPSHECRNPKAAYAIAVAHELFTKNGAPDWKAIQVEVPEFFGAKTTTTRKTAGAGTGKQPSSTASINDWIRQQAGINTQE
jgi:hypothetical protein